MSVLRVDYEYNAEAWWDAAHQVASLESSTFARLVNELDRNDEINVLRSELDNFLETASKLPGWDDGPAHARNPVTFE